MTRKQIIILISVLAGVGILIGAVFAIRYFQSRALDPVAPPTVTTPTNGAADEPTNADIQREIEMLAERPPDTDGDGLTDDEEAALGTDPSRSDTDGDGFNDYEEVKTFNQDPLTPDDAHAQRPTIEEARDARIERTGETPVEAAPPDSDNDGLDDEEEVRRGTDPDLADTDSDGLTDGAEVVRYGTDPTNPDTDGDGFNDGQEVAAGYSPRGAGECRNPECTP